MADREWVLPAFGARVKEHARRLGLASFWQWWMRELDALMPAAPRTALARRRMRPVLVFSGESATLWRPTTANGQPIMIVATTIPLTGDAASIVAAGRAALAPLLHARGGPAASLRMVISLPARDMLRRNIVLPAAVEENFRQALAYDLDRHTPFKAEELYFDAAIVDRDAVRSTITIDLAAALRERGHRVSLVATSFEATMHADDVRLPPGQLKYPSSPTADEDGRVRMLDRSR